MAQARPAAPQVLRQLLQPRDQPRARRHRRSRRVLRNVLAVAHRPPCPLFPPKVVPHGRRLQTETHAAGALHPVARRHGCRAARGQNPVPLNGAPAWAKIARLSTCRLSTRGGGSDAARPGFAGAVETQGRHARQNRQRHRRRRSQVHPPPHGQRRDGGCACCAAGGRRRDIRRRDRGGRDRRRPRARRRRAGRRGGVPARQRCAAGAGRPGLARQYRPSQRGPRAA